MVNNFKCIYNNLSYIYRNKREQKLDMSFSFYTMICCSVGSRGFTFIYKKGLVLLEIWPITVKNEKCSFNAHNDQLIDTMSLKSNDFCIYLYAKNELDLIFKGTFE